MKNPINHFATDHTDAGTALNQAHALAFAPYAFQAATILRDCGILALLETDFDHGFLPEEITASIELPDNSAHVLLEAGLAIGLTCVKDGRFHITKMGHYFANNDTIRINTSFMRDVCLPGISALAQSLKQSRPAGLAALGDWQNIFEGLASLPEGARESWFAFNNHHSDSAFRDALPLLFAGHPKRILDIGGSTGRFALACIDQSDEVHIGIADICIDVECAEPGVKAAVRAGRVTIHPMNILDAAVVLPTGYDTIWMSQFLPCFSEDGIAAVLAKCHAVLPADGRMYLMETFWDRQRFEAAAAALQLTSLYFVNVATGNSRLYRSDQLVGMLSRAGFEVAAQRNSIGRGHTLIELRKI